MKRKVAIALAVLFVLHTPTSAIRQGTAPTPQTASVNVTGDWLGVLTVQGLKLRLASPWQRMPVEA